MFQMWRMSDSYIKYFNIMCIMYIVYKSTYKTNPRCTGIYTQQIHKISSYMFRHSMGAIIREPSRWFKLCFWNHLLYVA